MPEDKEIQTLQGKIQTLEQLLGTVMNRANLAGKLGYQYGTDRNLYQALGYKQTITYAEYSERYRRQDIARAIIDRPVNAMWSGELEIIESDDEKKTALEKAWGELEEELKLKSRFVRLDKLAGIGHYGVLLLGLNDVRGKDDYLQPVVGGNKKLMYVKPLGEGSAVVSKWETKTRDPRFGMPSVYDVIMSDGENSSTSEIQVHHSRVIHVTDAMLESEVVGSPRLEAVFNRLMDLEKLVGGDAEMFWRGARPGFGGTVDKDFQMTAETKKGLTDQFDEYEHNLRRFLITEGVDIKALTQEIVDPKNHVDVQIQMISAVTGIPKRILTGSERGELASTQDKEEWLSKIQSRREEYAEPKIVRPFIDRCIEYGILPAAGAEGYTIKWKDLFAIAEKERVEIGKSRSEALAKYAASPMAEMVVPPEAFLKWFLGLEKDDIELIEEMRDAAILEEERMISEAGIEEEPTEIEEE